MAIIVPFRPSQAEAKSEKTGKRRRRSAEIIIFPGVRVEYWTEPPTATKSKKRTSKVRDVLELRD